MNTTEKESKTFNDKLKQFFRINKGNHKSRELVAVTQDVEKLICSEVPIHQRTRALKDLGESILKDSWEENSAERLWSLIQDLLSKDVPREHRHIVLNFLQSLIDGQYKKLSYPMRVKFFLFIKEHDIAEDIGPRLELLQKLTANGKDITHLEEKMGPFLLEWMPTVTGSDGKRGADFLSLLVNVIKYNSAYIDEEIISGLVLNVCHLCYYSNSEEVVEGCLNTLETIVGYNINLQSDSLQTFITALCRSVNVESYCQKSWNIMKKLLGTHMGHSALYTMCRLLQDENFQLDVRMLRGAVFFVNMGLWGTHKIPKLECTPNSVLPSFIQALKCNHPIVMYEVTIAVQRLVTKYGETLQEPTWSVLLEIIDHVINHTKTSNQPATKQVSSSLHETINSIENLIDTSQYNGNVKNFYDLIEKCSDARTEISILKLIDYRSMSIGPTYYKWQTKLAQLMERYFKIDTRTNIRIKVLDILSKVLIVNRSRYEDELIDRIVIPYFQHIDCDTDINVRNVAANLLIESCIECETKRCLELLDFLEKIINKPFNCDMQLTMDTDIKDIKTSVVGIINIFTTKLYTLPSNHAIRAYKILVNHIDQHYKEQKIFRDVSTIRYLIFECLLKIRANRNYHLGFPDKITGIVNTYSPYLLLENPNQIVTATAASTAGAGGATASTSNSATAIAAITTAAAAATTSGTNSPPPPSSPSPMQQQQQQYNNNHNTCQLSYLPLQHACKSIISCLKYEKDWKILQLILKEMPNVMQNRALILSRNNSDIDYLASALCSMVSDKQLRLPETLYNVPQKFTLSDFRINIFPILSSLASYHGFIEPNLQQRLIKCLELGLTTKCASQCVTSLTTCTLEMRDAMSKLVSEVVLNLSKISATVHIAIPILEFLSTLARLPKVYASFIENQYMSVFAILLPYTNPFKYNHYTVSLAHHVIAVWFLKCRLPFRRDFVKFITTGLKANVLVPFEEGGHLMKNHHDFSLYNEDSTNRKRSSSLTEQGSRGRRERPQLQNRIIGADLKPPIDEALMTFHVELTKTCIDLMARYTFSTYTARPKRSSVADFLLKEGQSMTWLLGNRLITITTSGCCNKSMRGNLCDNCWIACKTVSSSSTPDYRDRPSSIITRRTPSADGSKEEIRLSRQSSTGLYNQNSSSTNTAANSPTEEKDKKLFEDSELVKQFVSDNNSKIDETRKLEQILLPKKIDEPVPCSCWCQGWAEIYVRRPTGDMSWIMKIQNFTQLDIPMDFPINDITTLYMPTQDNITNYNRSQDTTTTTTTDSLDDEIEERTDFNNQNSNNNSSNNINSVTTTTTRPILPEIQTLNIGKSSGPIAIPGSPGGRPSPSRQSSRDSIEYINEDTDDCGGTDDDDNNKKPRNPVKRSKSSPEMAANWKNPFLNKDKLVIQQQQQDQQQQQNDVQINEFDTELKKHAKNVYTKDMRVSCEAIPEEISGMGTTPPSIDTANNIGTVENNNNINTNLLRTQHSFPGTNQSQHNSTGSNTVPPSPTATTSSGQNYLTVQNRSTQQLNLQSQKQPQSPTQLYSRTLSTTSDTNIKQLIQNNDTKPPIGRIYDKKQDDTGKNDPSTLPPLPFRDRGHTISVMSPVKSKNEWENNGNNKRTSTGTIGAATSSSSSISSTSTITGIGGGGTSTTQRTTKESQRTGINPSFIFLQLYHTHYFGINGEKPLIVPQTTAIQRAVTNFDRIQPYETHKIGVLFIGHGQVSNEIDILANAYGSLRYTEFLQNLGTLVRLKDLDESIFLGGLDRNGENGNSAYIWQDDVTQVAFHVATLMPNKISDPKCTSKKQHIGNNYVNIVYNESGEPYNIQTVKGQFNYACVVIQPLDNGINQVTVQAREELAEHIGHSEPKIISDQNLGILARQLALHANLASMVSSSLKQNGQNPYASNWLERLRHIKRLRERVLQETSSNNSDGPSDELTSRPSKQVQMDDFTEYTT